MKKLEIGEKYLSIKIVGHEYVVAFKNAKTKDNQPDYKADGIAIWIKTKKAEKESGVQTNPYEVQL